MERTTPGQLDDWAGYPDIGGMGHAGTINDYVRDMKPREFPIGFHVAAPGPSHPEPKPCFRVKAWSRRVP